MNLLWWLHCGSLLRPASSTLTGSLPHFPEWLRTTLQWAGRTSPHSIWKLCVGGEKNRVVLYPTCLKGTRSSMCVQISVTAGEFPCLHGPVGGKSDRVRVKTCRVSVLWRFVVGNPSSSINFLYRLLLHSGSRRFTGAYLSCHWVKTGLYPGQVVSCITGPHNKIR